MAIGVLDIKFVSRFVEMTGTSAMLAVMIGLAVGIDFALFIRTRRRSEEKGELQKEPPGGVATEPDDHGLGRSRGGLTTKLHLAVEQGQKPMSIVITAGQRGDSLSSRSSRVASGCPDRGRADREPFPSGCAQIRRTPPARTAPTCADVASDAPSQTRPTRSATRWCRASGSVASTATTAITVRHDAFEGIDSAEAFVKLVRGEELDRLDVAAGDLLLAGEPCLLAVLLDGLLVALVRVQEACCGDDSRRR